MIERWFVLETHAMAALFVNVQVKRHMVSPQSFRKHHRVFHRDNVVFIRRPEKTGWSLGSHLQFIREVLDQVRRRVIAQKVLLGTLMSEFAHGDDRVTQYSKVRPGTLALDGVAGIRIARIKVGEKSGSQMAAG